MVNLFIGYELDTWSRGLKTNFIIKGCLFGSLNITKNTDPDKYKYSSYGMRFHTRSEFSLPDGSRGKNVIIFGVDMSLSEHIDNKKKDILVFDKHPTQGLDDTS